MQSDDPAEPVPKARKRIRASVACVLLLFVGLSYAILAPLYKSAEEMDQQSTCQSNIKQLGVAMSQYVSDNNEHFPPAKNWVDCISPYVPSHVSGKPSIFHCPAATNTNYGYGLNGKLNLWAEYADVVSEPADLVMLFDARSTIRNAVGLLGDVDWGRHPGSANIGFADGHARGVMGSVGHPDTNNVTLNWSP